ncbi:hypothetical protein H0H93_011371 [Arthromyces matolae]|nr:hypothetical protein H0H93_011371 [Arthromyces matolae]
MTIILKNVAMSGGAPPRTICNVSPYLRRISLQFPTSWAFEYVQLFNTNDGLLAVRIFSESSHIKDDKIPSKLRELGDVVPLLPLVGKIDITGQDLCQKLLALPLNTISDRLIHLELQDVDGESLDKGQITAFRVANRLQTVRITGYKTSNLFRHGALQCKNLTVMWIVVLLSGYGPLSFLRQCVNLQELTLSQHPFDSDKFSTSLTWGGQMLVTLPRLVKLRILTEYTAISNVFAVLNVPAVRSFEFRCHRSSFVFIPIRFVYAFSRLHTLSIPTAMLHTSRIVEIISSCTSLSSLTIVLEFTSGDLAPDLLVELRSKASRVPLIERFQLVFTHYRQLTDVVSGALFRLLRDWMEIPSLREALANVVIMYDITYLGQSSVTTSWTPWIAKVQNEMKNLTGYAGIFDLSFEVLPPASQPSPFDTTYI